MNNPICPFCKKDLNVSNIGYQLIDMSVIHFDLRFTEIFYCRECGAALSINKGLKDDLMR